MANKQGWEDFGQLVSMFKTIHGQVQEICKSIVKLQKDKVEIMDDQDRVGEVTKIVNIHPDYSISDMQNQYSKAIALKNYLETNGYI